MTLGSTNREVWALEKRVKLLEDTKGSFPAELRSLAKSYAEQSFNRLVIWTIAAACVGGGLVLVLKL